MKVLAIELDIDDVKMVVSRGSDLGFRRDDVPCKDEKEIHQSGISIRFSDD